jgi:hypothetical protein
VLRAVIGVLLLVVGIIWFVQGIGVLHGSFMTGTAFWAIMGALVVIFAAYLIISGLRQHPDIPE